MISIQTLSFSVPASGIFYTSTRLVFTCFNYSQVTFAQFIIRPFLELSLTIPLQINVGSFLVDGFLNGKKKLILKLLKLSFLKITDLKLDLNKQSVMIGSILIYN